VVSESIASTRKDIVNNENGRWFLGDEWDMLDTINDERRTQTLDGVTVTPVKILLRW
jgi:hypothetical protein